MFSMDAEETVTIHGGQWKWRDIAEEVAACRKSQWHQQAWRRRPALVHNSGGRVSLYHGQQFDPEKITLVADGWSHDHCEICWWTLSESSEQSEGVGYTDGQSWICTECYEAFIREPRPNI